MIAAVDIETYKKKGKTYEPELDATQFTLGVLWIEGNKKPEVYYDKKDLWERILTLGRKERKRGRPLQLYGHNHEYDFYGYADIIDPNLNYFCTNPFIVSYTENGMETVKFLDTMAIYKMSLAKVGELLKIPKKEMPTSVTSKEELIPYCTKDVEITLKAVRHMKDKLAEDGINIKRIMTISQIAIGYHINTLKKMKFPEDMDKEVNGKTLRQNHIFDSKDKGRTHRTLRAEEIHAAYRGGRVEAFKTGLIKGVSSIDINNLYGKASTEIRYPDLRTERKTWKPLQIWNETEWLNKIGVSRALLKNKTNELGLLQIRTQDSNYYPKTGKYLIGTWTHDEIKTALNEGYEILSIEWGVIWEEGSNPYKIITPILYTKRNEANDEFDRYYYKQLMNRSYGKLAQRNMTGNLTIDTVEKAKEYIKNNYKVIQGIGYNYLYQNQEPVQIRKPYYAPIIPCLINAKARIIIYNEMKKYDLNNLIYTDTDSIYYTGPNKGCKIGKHLGEFKQEHNNEEMLIYGRKTYMIGKEIKASGIHKSDLNPDKFTKGYAETTKMQTIKIHKTKQEIGQFRYEQRDFHEQHEQYINSKELLSEQDIYIDNDITNIGHFIPFLKQVNVM